VKKTVEKTESTAAAVSPEEFTFRCL